MLGNPVTGCDGKAYGGEDDILFPDTRVNLFYWHAMVSRRDYDEWNNKGCGTSNPPSFPQCLELFATISNGIGSLDQPLREMANRMYSERKAASKHRLSERSPGQPSGSINPDCLYYSYCTGNATLEFNEASIVDCFNVEDQISAYLNTPDVQKAIHAKPKLWKSCGGVLYDQNVKSLIPYLQYIFANAPTTRVLYYSGDIDIATVPFANTQRCLETMNSTILKKWRPWVINKEVAGYVEIYPTYTYATLKGAGHEAPAYQPASAYLLFTSFLANKPLPSPND